MRLANIIGIALTASIVVAAAFIAKNAHSAEPPRMWLESLEEPVNEIVIRRRRDGFVEEGAKFATRDGAIGVIRKPGAELPATRTLAAREADAFEREVKRRFHSGRESVIAYQPAAPLAPDGLRLGGFVSRVEAGGKICDFGVAGFTDAAGGERIVAVARILLCEPGGQLTPPDIRLSALLAHSDRAE